MGSYCGPNSVMSGLVLKLDVGNTKSYSGGTTLNDVSGNGNTVALVNSPTYSSLYGGSFSFNGSNQYINSPLTKSATCTFSCWASSTNVSNNPMMFNAGPSGAGPALYFTGGYIEWNIWDSGNRFSTIPTNANDGKFHHYAVVNDATSGVKLYYDGTLLGTATYRNASGNTNLTIGGNTSFFMWNGNISNFTVQNRALSAAEVLQEYNILKSRYIDPPASVTPSIVTSGLVLNLDAGNTASYPGTGTAWTDLSGVTSNSTLTNGPTYNSANGGSIVFDGSNDLVSVPTTSIHNFSASRITIELWMKTNGTPTPRQLIVNTDTSGDVSSWSLGFALSNFAFVMDVYQSAGTESSSPRIATSSFPVNTWTHVVATSSGEGSVGKMYINGVSQIDGTATTYQLPYDSGRPIGIGLEPTTGRDPFKGSIGVVRIYKDKAFTQAEVTQNFEALRGRYGI